MAHETLSRDGALSVFREQRRQLQMFRLGAPVADLKVESTLALVNPVTAAQGSADVTVVLGTRNANTGLAFTNNRLFVVLSQVNNTLTMNLPSYGSGAVALSYSPGPRVVVVGLDMASQTVKAWVNGILEVEGAFVSATWDDDVTPWVYTDHLVQVDATLLPAEFVFGKLPGIF